MIAEKHDRNFLCDVELVGVTDGFGFVAATSRDNLACTCDLLTKRCGENNTVIGTKFVDTSAEPCYEHNVPGT
ncbi:hypothetical protein JXA70_08440 [candidate division KSB1 bacterium]|nr:hypothetical protein [candidate division KSB1 bacterium]